jgi:hypothetical protein
MFHACISIINNLRADFRLPVENMKWGSEQEASGTAG